MKSLTWNISFMTEKHTTDGSYFSWGLKRLSSFSFRSKVFVCLFFTPEPMCFILLLSQIRWKCLQHAIVKNRTKLVHSILCVCLITCGVCVCVIRTQASKFWNYIRRNHSPLIWAMGLWRILTFFIFSTSWELFPSYYIDMHTYV